jgi:hypothetical protein
MAASDAVEFVSPAPVQPSCGIRSRRSQPYEPGQLSALSGQRTRGSMPLSGVRPISRLLATEKTPDAIHKTAAPFGRSGLVPVPLWSVTEGCAIDLAGPTGDPWRIGANRLRLAGVTFMLCHRASMRPIRPSSTQLSPKGLKAPTRHESPKAKPTPSARAATGTRSSSATARFIAV